MVHPGGIIGRMPSAALCVDHPTVSEAHALVSLRGRELYLLALRGRLEVDGRPVPHVRITPGLQVRLAPGIEIAVRDLCLPDSLLAIEGVGSRPVPLTHSVYTLCQGPPIELQPGFRPDGDGWIWMADGIRAQLRGESPRPLRQGDRLHLPTGTLVVRELQLCDGGTSPTRDSGRRGPALRVVSRHETLHIHREDGVFFAIGGIPARIVSELSEYGVPVRWTMVADRIWPDVAEESTLRANWDRHVKRLRRKLRAAGLRDDLVRADGRGNVELFLMPGDELLDQG
ncbi:MAG: FHA domain-containing protein [Deltaproteobacteria bacterium]|nr:MAG: FHA domain-containing protein [Deltaproteobacteria bacterium]